MYWERSEEELIYVFIQYIIQRQLPEYRMRRQCNFGGYVHVG